MNEKPEYPIDQILLKDVKEPTRVKITFEVPDYCMIPGVESYFCQCGRKLIHIIPEFDKNRIRGVCKRCGASEFKVVKFGEA